MEPQINEEDLYSIQEFSQLSGVEASTLRYWDDIGLFSPIHRNPDNNYRYYSLAQIPALNFVTILSELDFPLKTIADLRQDRNPERLLRLLDTQEKAMDMEMQRLRLRYSIIHARRELINHGMSVNEDEITIQKRETTTIVVWPRNEYGESDTFIEPLATSIGEAKERHINFSFPVCGLFDDLEALSEAPNRPQYFFSIDPMGLQSIKAGEYLTGYQRGYFGEMGDLPERMLSQAKEQAVTLTGPAYAIYLLEGTCMQRPEDYLVQVIAPVVRPGARPRRQMTLKR